MVTINLSTVALFSPQLHELHKCQILHNNLLLSVYLLLLKGNLRNKTQKKFLSVTCKQNQQTTCMHKAFLCLLHLM